MKMPSKGTPVYIEDGGCPLFVGASNLDSDKAKVMLKYEGGGLDEGYGRGIVTIDLEKFKQRRIYAEQLSDSDSIRDIITPNKLRPD